MKVFLGIGLALTVVLLPSAALAEHIRGTQGDETLLGTSSRDWIEARDLADYLGGDVIDCGPGEDVVEYLETLDPEEDLASCETVREYLGP